jgi:hypothetical protein
MKINSIPIQAYRRFTDRSIKPQEKDTGGLSGARASRRPETLTLPATGDGDVDSLSVRSSTSVFQEVLSPDERRELIRNFARFGDTPNSSQIYRQNARTGAASSVGYKVDCKG